MSLVDRLTLRFLQRRFGAVHPLWVAALRERYALTFMAREIANLPFAIYRRDLGFIEAYNFAPDELCKIFRIPLRDLS
jgi:hypothetical protein